MRTHTEHAIARWKHTCSDKSAIGERDAEVAAGRRLMPPDIHSKSGRERERERDVHSFIRTHIYMPAYMHTYMHTVEMSRIPPSLFSTSIRRGTCVE